MRKDYSDYDKVEQKLYLNGKHLIFYTNADKESEWVYKKIKGENNLKQMIIRNHAHDVLGRETDGISIWFETDECRQKVNKLTRNSDDKYRKMMRKSYGWN